MAKMHMKKILLGLAGISLLGTSIGVSVFQKSTVLETHAADTLNYNETGIEIRITTPDDWVGTPYIHTWHNGSGNVAYEMTYLWGKVWAWTSTSEEPLYENFAYEVGNWAKQSSDLVSPRSAGIYLYTGTTGSYQTVDKMRLYFYDYDNSFNGQTITINGTRDQATRLTFDNGNIQLVQETEFCNNGRIYYAEVSNAVDRAVVTCGAWDSSASTAWVGGNYVYVYGSSMSTSAWWDNINYVQAHNWAMNTMKFNGAGAIDHTDENTHVSTADCSTNYYAARTGYKKLYNDSNIIGELDGEAFPNALARFEKWAEANGDTFDSSTMVLTERNGSQLRSVSERINGNDFGFAVIFVAAVIAIAALGVSLFVSKKKQAE